MNATEWNQAADEIEWFAKRLQGFMAVAAELRRIGSLEQAAQEAMNRSGQAARFDVDIAKQLADTREIAARAQEEHEKKMADLRAKEAEKAAQVAAIGAVAEAQRDSIIAQAKKDAEEIMADAVKKAKAQKKATEAMAEVAKEETDAANAELAKLIKEIEVFRTERDKVKDEIDSLKKRLG